MSVIGDVRQSDVEDSTPGGISAERLRSIVERAERIADDRKSLGDDLRDLFIEARSAGFDPKAIRRILAIRKRDAADVQAEEDMVDLYRRALGV